MPSVKCARLDYEDIRSAEALKADGWREVEILETWRRKAEPLDVSKISGEANIRRAEQRDQHTVIWIAQTSFTHDRLHKDRTIPSAEADQAKGEWVRKAFSGEADRIFVAEIDKHIVGFIICKVLDGRGVIDLIAVDRRWRGHGVGTQLVVYALHHYGLDMEAGTQETNKEGRGLYERHGFKLVRRRRTFHK